LIPTWSIGVLVPMVLYNPSWHRQLKQKPSGNLEWGIFVLRSTQLTMICLELDMITQEEKFLVYMQHQPYITWYDINEFVIMYNTDNPKITFTEFVNAFHN